MAKKRSVKVEKTDKASSLEKLKEAYNKRDSGGSGVRWWRPEWGDNVIRILPEIEQDDVFYFETATHYIDNERYYCLSFKTDEETGKKMKCPICEARRRLFRSGDEDLAAIAKEFKPKLQYLMNIVEVKKQSDETPQVKVWGAGVKIWKKIVKDMLDDDLLITDVEEGYDFKVIKDEGAKTEKGTFPNYDASKIARRASPLSEDEEEIEAILDQRYVLSDIPKFDSYESLETMIENYINSITNSANTEDEEFYDEDEDEDKSPKKGKSDKSKLDEFKKKLNRKMDED